MNFVRDTRGVSEVIGAMLVFGMIIGAIGLFQVTVVPHQNRLAEIDHNEELRAEMLALGDATVNGALAAERRSLAVDTEAQYPLRTVGANPASSAGTITSSTAYPVTILGATASGPAAVYWDGSAKTVETQLVTFAPSYVYYGEAPTTTVEPLGVYSDFRGVSLAESPQRLVDGRTVTLTTITARPSSYVGGATSFDVVPSSAAGDGVRIVDGFDLTVPTTVREATWEAALEEQPHATLSGYDDSGDVAFATVSLADNQVYTLYAGAASLDGRGESQPAYLLSPSGSSTVELTSGGDAEVRVFDGFGNPVGDVSVSASEVGDTSVQTVTTIVDGRASFAGFQSGDEFEAWAGADSYSETAALLRGNYTVVETVGGDTTGVNPSGPDDVKLINQSQSGSEVQLRFETTTGSKVMNQARLNFYNAQSGSSGPSDPAPSSAELYESSTPNETSAPLVIGEDFEETPAIGVTPAGTVVVLDFDSNVGPNDWFVLTLVFEDGSRSQYFVSF